MLILDKKRPATSGVANEGTFMGILVKSTVWLSLVLLAVPFGGGEGSVGPIQALGAAREAIGDVTSLCERKPEVCDTGRAAFRTIAVRAQEASRMALALLDEGKVAPAEQDITVDRIIADSDAEPAKNVDITGSVPAAQD